jgi:hypothetical protein
MQAFPGGVGEIFRIACPELASWSGCAGDNRVDSGISPAVRMGQFVKIGSSTVAEYACLQAPKRADLYQNRSEGRLRSKVHTAVESWLDGVCTLHGGRTLDGLEIAAWFESWTHSVCLAESDVVR